VSLQVLTQWEIDSYTTETDSDCLFLGLAKTIYIRCTYDIFGLGNHHIYDVYIRIYTVLANPIYFVTVVSLQVLTLWKFVS